MESLSQILIFKLYVVGFGISFVAQSLTQVKFGRESAWGINRGWQTEIAIWNVFAIIVLTALIVRNFNSDLVVLGLFTMSLGFGVNHLTAANRGVVRRSNLLGAAANACGLILIVLWFLFSGH